MEEDSASPILLSNKENPEKSKKLLWPGAKEIQTHGNLGLFGFLSNGKDRENAGGHEGREIFWPACLAF